jgi:alkylation response protein AidB-like acyl-CoA dehydrogenase
MRFTLSDEQLFLQEAADQALGRHDILGAARAALDGERAPSLWPTAVEAGWAGLLVGEDAGGAELGALEAMLVVQACGRALGDGHLAGHLPATAVLEASGDELAVRSALAAGDKRAVLVDGRGGVVGANREADCIRLSGEVDWVVDAPGADVLVVCFHDDCGGLSAAFVEAGAGGCDVEDRRSYDGARSLARVSLTDAVCRTLAAEPQDIRNACDLQRALLGAEALGAAERCLLMATEHAKDRAAFGRPIGSYQAIKHKLVEMLRRIDNTRSLTYFAGWAWDRRREDFTLAANAVRVAGGDALDYAAPENIFIHGAVGATWEHDASLFYRRAQLTRRLAGGADAAADVVAGELLAGAGQPQTRQKETA